MKVKALFVEGYRSIKSAQLNLRQLNVISGPNGCGKSNLYRSMYLLHTLASGAFGREICNEGGLNSALWAGKRSAEPVRLKLDLFFDDLRYTFECGLPIQESRDFAEREPSKDEFSAFDTDPEIKTETISFSSRGKKIILLERKGQNIMARNEAGKRVQFGSDVQSNESVLSALSDPHNFPEISVLKQRLLSFRFYHEFRTDSFSPIRKPQPGVRTPVLSHDGSDLGAALQTIIEIGDVDKLHKYVQLAFPGGLLDTATDTYGVFCPSLRMPEFGRAFEARELSDGTLHYLCLLASLLSPRPPALLALNEPEGSLHPSLYLPLAELIADASADSQIWITTHSQELADHLLDLTGYAPIELYKQDGQTLIKGAKLSLEDELD